MSIYIYIPAIVALIIKFVILYWYRGLWMTSAVLKTFLGLLVVQSIANSLELAGYYYGTTLVSTVFLLKIYYISLFWLGAFLLQISMLIVNKKLDRRWGDVNYVIAATMTAAFLFSDLIISGAESIGYTVTRIPGPYYWVFQIYAIAMSILPIGVCIHGYRTLENHFDRIRCMYLLIAVCFQVAPILIVIPLMALGVKISTAVILPIGHSLFLLTMSYALNNDVLYDIRMWVPFTQVYKLDMARHKEFLVSSDGSEMSAKEKKQSHERRVLIRALIMTDGNQRQAAKRLGISESAISIKRKQYEI